VLTRLLSITTRVASVEPEQMLSIFSNEKLGLIAGQVRKDLSHVVEEIANS
jgi:hypothetical protein